MPKSKHIVILAAGLGRRFREGTFSQPSHKALASVWDDRGTLAILLQHLKNLGIRPEDITIATGFMASSIAAVADKICKGLHYQFNPHYATDTMLQTLSRTFLACPGSGSCWVLFADTLYSRNALAHMLAATDSPDHSSMPLVAVKKLALADLSLKVVEKREILVSLSEDQQFVVEFNSEHNPTHHMAHAVYWPIDYQRLLINSGIADTESAISSTQYASQWQLLQQWIEQNRTKIYALLLAGKASQDIDTKADLQQLQHFPLIDAKHLDYFSSNLCKDKRSLAQSDKHLDDVYFKHCSSAEAAQHECRVMQYLQQHDPSLVPEIISLQGNRLTMKLVSGIRLYDLLRYTSEHKQAEQIKHILLQRCTERLLKTQKILSKNQANISNTAYPFELQFSQLLSLLTEVLAIAVPDKLQSELEQLADQWEGYCSVPFRDATPKNIIIVDADVSALIEPNLRHQNISALAERPLSYWQNVPIQDVDFTSTYHLTTPEDDLISLMAHASTFTPTSLSLITQLVDDSERCQERFDMTVLMRYLRFGGRKLAYKLLNPRGFEVRFRYDEPCFYFEKLLQILSVEFRQNYPALSFVLGELRDTAERYRGVQFTPYAQDAYLLSMNTPFRYWQESPLELHARGKQ
ncbi:MAG: NTP transferase domain-containing protein [Pararheinheimera sp.]|nr:NTP transferase domain-containing protein [Rheinheimera sp.]